MPTATLEFFSRRSALPVFAAPLCLSAGKLSHSQASAITATGTTQKNAPRQPIRPPRKLPSGAAITVARALPPLTMAKARGTWAGSTRRIAVAADSDQKPPIATPINARPNMNTA